MKAAPDPSSKEMLPLAETPAGEAVRAAMEAGRAAAAPLFRLDPGWLFMAAGMALIAATVLIPAVDDLRDAEWNRDRARSVERYRQERLENYAGYLDAVRREDRTLVVSLAATQLNLAPADKQAMLDRRQMGLPDAGVYAALEADLMSVPKPPEPNSWLQRWATNERTRMWLIAAGALSILVGLLPMARPSRPMSEL